MMPRIYEHVFEQFRIVGSDDSSIAGRVLASGSSLLRKWAWVHKWSSIVCTIFMLLLCITGLPLIFHEEIDDLLHEQVKAAAAPEGTPLVDLDRALASGLAAAPRQVAHFLIWDPDDGNSLLSSVGPSIDVNPTDNRTIGLTHILAASSTRPTLPGASLTLCSSSTPTCSPVYPESCF